MAGPENMAETNQGTGPEAPAGVPKSAYEVSQATWGGKNPLESVRGQLLAPEAELNPEGKDPANVVSIMQRIDTEDAETRESHKDFFQRTCDILKIYAHKEKLLGLDAKTILLEEDLKGTDKAKVDEVGADLQELLDNLDATDEELRRIDNTLREDQFKGLFSEKAWEQLQETREELAEDKDRFEQAITSMTDSGFLVSRNEAKVQIREAQAKAEADDREKKKADIKEQLALPEDWEQELEKQLLEEERIVLNLDDEHAPNYHGYFASLPFAQVLEYVNNPNNQTAANIEQAKEVLAWYFQEAKRFGVLADLDERLEQKYIEWVSSLLPHREMSQIDMLTDSQGRLTRKTFAEAEDEVIEYFNSLLDSSKPQYVEHSARWEFLQRRGLTPQARGFLQGIRAEFIRRAQAQIEDSLLNWDRELKGLPPIPLLGRISGEWNVQRVDRVIRERRERQALEAGSEPLYREETYFRIRLLGNTRQELEIGADQAAENIIQSATTFDLQIMEQRMEMLRKALREKSTDLQRSERISKKEADDIIQQIEDSVTNKIDFFILDWAGQNLQTELFNSYLKKRMLIRGVEKLRQTPAMNDGLVGMALSLLISDQYRLYFRPQGFKGQLFDDDTTHKYLRSLLQSKLISTLMEYELKGENNEEKNRSRETLTKVSTADQFLSNFERRESPVIRLESLRQHYQQELQRVRGLKEQGNATLDDLARLRAAREALALEQRGYQELERKANGAFTIAAQVMNIFGEAAELGAPSIVMDNGDYIRLDDAVLFYKYAILEAAKKHKDQSGGHDNPALIRWRTRMWIQRWKAAGLDRNKAGRVFHKGGKEENYNPLEVTLQAGFEETGLTKEEWDAFEEAVREIRKNGFNAQINGVKFEDIIKMVELKPVRNNFLADYKSSESQINNEVVLEQVAKGKLPVIRNILRRLGLKGREGISGKTTQQRIDNLTQMIEDSRALDAELERLAYFEATHGLLQEGQDPRMLSFSADRIDYGFQNESWAVKRLHHLKAFWYANLRRTVPRAVDLIHALPFSLGSLSQEMTFENILELALNVNTVANGLESVDNPALTMFADRHTAMAYLRTRSEGGVDLERGKLWGILEKPLLSVNSSLWTLFKGKMEGLVSTAEAVKYYLENPAALGEDEREDFVRALWRGEESVLGRFAPIVIGTEKELAEDRQALSSGAGYEENEKFALRFLEWLRSGKPDSEEHGEREAGGVEAYKEVADIIKIITAPNSYRVGASIWDEVWRQLTPGHNPRLPKRAPEPTYV